jgi:hypothetical protein
LICWFYTSNIQFSSEGEKKYIDMLEPAGVEPAISVIVEKGRLEHHPYSAPHMGSYIRAFLPLRVTTTLLRPLDLLDLKHDFYILIYIVANEEVYKVG